MTTQEEYAEAAHYMRVFQGCDSYMQPEVRKAIDIALNVLLEKL